MRSTSTSGNTMRRAFLPPGRPLRPCRNASRLMMRWSRVAARSSAARNPARTLLMVAGFMPLATSPSRQDRKSRTVNSITGLVASALVKCLCTRAAFAGERPRLILFVLIDRLGDDDRAAIVFTVAGLSACDLARDLDRCPIVEDMLAVGRLIVVREADLLGPVAAVLGAADRPAAGAGLLAPVAKRDVRRHQ